MHLNRRNIIGVGAITTLVAIVLLEFAPVTASPVSMTARLWSVADSPFFIAVFSTSCAAFAGTWGAQLLAERTARRKELLTEIRGTNAAIGLAYNIANAYIVTKKQLVRDLVANYEQQRLDWLAYLTAIANGQVTQFKLQLTLRTLSVPFLPIEELQKILRDRISPDGKAPILLTPLTQSIHGFADTLVQHNAWIEEIKRLPANDDFRRAHLYFGTPFALGCTDERFPNFIKSIDWQTDDCIAFSIMITKSLKRYGDRLAKQYGQDAPNIPAPDFDTAGDLLPNLDEPHYTNWIKN